ncbi:metal-binding protein [Pseudomonas syringae]|nr:Ada metal-binding domain-containing protein [Pseudomonas syringae]QQQ48948.1 metal-binding protein [Pseudomonas syringae]
MWKLVDAQGETFLSREPGRLGGHRRSKIYGRLNCLAALLALSKGGYRQYRVFFIDEPTAISAGFRPCGRCMAAEYRHWKSESRSNVKLSIAKIM